jgi:predicted PurR-regulated permease PerM
MGSDVGDNGRMGDGFSANERSWISREQLLTVSLGLLTLLALYVCYRIIQPFIPAVAIAIAAAVATRRPHQWLRRRLHSNTFAAIVSVILIACLIIVPAGFLITYVVQQIISGVQQMESDSSSIGMQILGHLPPSVNRAIDWIEGNLDLRAQIMRLGQSIAGKAGGLLASSAAFITQLVIMLFVLFFLLRDGGRALASLRHRVPLTNNEFDRMVRRVEDTILATLNGSLTVAAVQATLAGAMYSLLDVPAAAIWAAATFFAALLPMLGTVLIWGPVSLYLLLSGTWVKAVVLVGWGMLAVGTIDNLLYPLLVGGRLRMHPVPTFFSIVGGIALFGPAGLILGPVTIAVTVALLDVWRWRTAEVAIGGETLPSKDEPPLPV